VLIKKPKKLYGLKTRKDMLNWILQGATKKIKSKLRTEKQKAALLKAQAAAAAKRKRKK
jgi:hypothetical protein